MEQLTECVTHDDERNYGFLEIVFITLVCIGDGTVYPQLYRDLSLLFLVRCICVGPEASDLCSWTRWL